MVVAPLAQSIAMRSFGRAGGGSISCRCAQVLVAIVRARRCARRARRPTVHDGVGDDRFDLALERLGELLARAREHLDAVVLERIVRGRDHHARREALERREIGHRRRGHDAEAGQLAALVGDAARQLALDPLPGLARVAARPGSARAPPGCRAAARAPAPRPAAAPSAGRADTRRPCLERHRYRTVAPRMSVSGLRSTVSSHRALSIADLPLRPGPLLFTSVTVTRTLRVDGTRTVGSTTPTVTTSVTVAVALAIDTGSVIASVSPRTAVAGPAITTVGGSLVIAPMRKPGGRLTLDRAAPPSRSSFRSVRTPSPRWSAAPARSRR